MIQDMLGFIAFATSLAIQPAAVPAPLDVADVEVSDHGGAALEIIAYGPDGSILGTVAHYRDEEGRAVLGVYFPDGLYSEVTIDLSSEVIARRTNAESEHDANAITARTNALQEWFQRGGTGDYLAHGEASKLKCGASVLVSMAACAGAANPLAAAGCLGAITWAYCECGVEVEKHFDVELTGICE